MSRYFCILILIYVNQMDQCNGFFKFNILLYRTEYFYTCVKNKFYNLLKL